MKKEAIIAPMNLATRESASVGRIKEESGACSNGDKKDLSEGCWPRLFLKPGQLPESPGEPDKGPYGQNYDVFSSHVWI